ncbi:molybdopterin-containing oxidoreductase family protein [Quisquiliibacterium transsilvanicum]|uniref:Anaerobic selenocysteine-containing dehydrogenase n=1 Tax=Quisquiliibacterium transsilvanicum TaxID=1549638 RepID=A0A7W8HJX0_9BURK|nr:molybdopterin oxidoreductase family protein [Quisquiliibacterium transsilvanicum]MBB5273414.1 anaerobic selenocysteine-containing dehydrogenase [Quisquiliibacterium transsilvanicum]
MDIKAGDIVVKGACPHDCPDTCALHVTVRDGRAIRVAGDPDHPTTRGVLCTKVSRYTERTYHPDRVLTPLRRIGPKGSGRFEPVGWDEALDAIAARLQAIAARDPQRILPYSYCGTMGWVQGEGMASRFFHRLGASRLDRTICASAGMAGLEYTMGAAVGMDVERFVDSGLILIWGTNAITSNLHFWSIAQEAKRRGARLVAIDPYRSDTAMKCDRHVALLPGTDAALALGIANVLIGEDLLDHDYIARHTLGFDALRARAAEYPPERVARICGIAADDVTWLARALAGTRPAAIRVGYGLQRTRGGANAVRAVMSLPALTGAWRDAGGGALLSTSGHFPQDLAALTRPDLMPGWPGALPRVVNMVEIGDALLGADPPIEAVVVYNSNPVAVAPDSEKVIRGFAREDLFTVVLEHFLTDTADHADYVLPATTQLEHFDLHKTYGHRYLVANNPAIAPLGQARANSDIFRALAQRMGFDDPCFAETDEQVAAAALRWDDPRIAGVTLGQIREHGWLKLKVPDAPFAQGGFPTPSGKCELASPRLAQQGLDPVPDFLPPHESAASAPELAARYPLALISPPARNFLNSTFVNVDSLRASEKAPGCELHPEDAAARGIADGDQVRVFNDRGAFLARARVSERARRGVAVAWGVWWHKLAPGGRSVNAVTSQALTDMGRAPTFYDCLVEIAGAQE